MPVEIKYYADEDLRSANESEITINGNDYSVAFVFAVDLEKQGSEIVPIVDITILRIKFATQKMKTYYRVPSVSFEVFSSIHEEIKKGILTDLEYSEDLDREHPLYAQYIEQVF